MSDYENRRFDRVHINIETIIFLKTEEKLHELIGKILNISACGVLVEVPLDAISDIGYLLTSGQIFHFQSFDEYSLADKHFDEMLDNDAIIVWKEIRNSHLVLGCKFKHIDHDIDEYANRKRIATYLMAGPIEVK